MKNKIIIYVLPLSFICMLCFFTVSCCSPNTSFYHMETQKKYRIAIATNPNRHMTCINTDAINALKKLSLECDFDFVHIECPHKNDWVENVGKIHEQTPIDVLIGVSWEGSEFFPIIQSKYEDIHYIVLDNKIASSDIKSIQFSRYESAYIVGAMIGTAFPDENLFGFIASFETNYTNTFLQGYTDGLHSVNPNINVEADYTHNYDSEEMAYDIAKVQQELGIKFTLSILSTIANAGVYKLAQESINTETPIYMASRGSDKTQEDTPFILTGITINVKQALREVVNDFIAHGFNTNPLTLGVHNEGTEVLLLNADNTHYRNEKIMTDDVIKAGQKALEFIIKK